ncbi:hypothetical protein ACFPYI_14595 [Halomarina salina]|uniref:Uncharacterized protein n=1 Tax=Halomarina salina TaxID=1872699 RepID=A0ABD5RPJ2_9EURY|nr:hypothetical protein [Halomarina salina]
MRGTRRHESGKADLIRRTAEAIDDAWQSVWGDSTTGERILIAVFLVVTGLAIPVVPIVFVARYIAR